jgi:MFS family permease
VSTAFLLRHAPFRAFLIANITERLASSAFTVLLGFQVYQLTHRPLDLGLLGLAQAIPGVSLVLYGGHVADTHSRKKIAVIASALMTLLAASVAAMATWSHQHAFFFFLALAFLFGTVRAFEDPAAAGLEAQVVPVKNLISGISLLATSGGLCDIAGPSLGGLAYSAIGAVPTFATIAALFGISCALVLIGVPDAGPPPRAQGDEAGAFRRILEGVRYTIRDQVLFGSMMLDLFAVFFGGATALLPVFATSILQVGASGFGLLRSATGAGAFVAAITAGRFLPQRRAGHALFGVIACFGIAIIVFGLSRSLPLSLAALFVAGLCDGTSMVIRRAILRLASPEGMRGRIAAMKSVFVGSSNELGAFESGIAASLFGAPAAVWGGGLVTLAVVAITASVAPRLRALDLTRLRPQPIAPRFSPARAPEDRAVSPP